MAVSNDALRKFGEEIKRRRLIFGVTQDELGTTAGLGKGNISRIESGKQEVPLATLGRLARALHCEVYELFLDHSPKNGVTFSTAKPGRPVPLISFSDIKHWLTPGFSVDSLDKPRVFKPTDLDNLSMMSFALEIKDRTNYPEFSPGDCVFIDPSVAPIPGDFVAAHDEQKDKSHFLKYRPRGMNEKGQDVFELVPVNDDYPSLRSDLYPIKIMGVMVEHRRYRNKRD